MDTTQQEGNANIVRNIMYNIQVLRVVCIQLEKSNVDEKFFTDSKK